MNIADIKARFAVAKTQHQLAVCARQDIPDLLSEIERLTQEVERLREALRPFAKEALQKEPTFMRHDLNHALEVLEGRALTASQPPERVKGE